MKHESGHKRNQAAKFLLLGGVDAVSYTSTAKEIRISHVPHKKRFKNSQVSSFDAVICLTGNVSHPAVKGVKSICRRYGIPIYFVPSSGGTRLRCFLQDICGELCLTPATGVRNDPRVRTTLLLTKEEKNGLLELRQERARPS